MKKDIWLKPGKELNTGAIIGGIGFAIYIALSALEWRGLALFAALAFGLEAGYAFLSALDCRERIRTPSATTSCGAPARWRS